MNISQLRTEALRLKKALEAAQIVSDAPAIATLGAQQAQTILAFRILWHEDDYQADGMVFDTGPLN